VLNTAYALPQKSRSEWRKEEVGISGVSFNVLTLLVVRQNDIQPVTNNYYLSLKFLLFRNKQRKKTMGNQVHLEDVHEDSSDRKL